MTVLSSFVRASLSGAALMLAAFCGQAQAQSPELSALARLDPARSAVTVVQTGRTEVALGLSQGVPFRAFLLDAPPRLVVDFRAVDFGAGRREDFSGRGLLGEVRWGGFRPGWSRFVAELTGPARLVSAEMRTGQDAAQTEPGLHLVLESVTPADFAPQAGAAQSALWDLPQPAPTPAALTRQDGSRPLRVMLDPGHGGIDPGAEADGYSEAVLVLTFARELKEVMARAGIDVAMTREENIFVPLEDRITAAHDFGADLMLSLHADALAEGEAMGATLYLFDEDASEEAAQKLAERHDRSDLLAGVDLAGHDDAVAGVLMDLARAETQPRAVRLGQVLAGAIKGAGLRMHRRPVQGADFAVLRSPDIPSALLELGFMSSDIDRARLHDETWRAQMVAAITAGVQRWAKADAAEARLLRQ